MVLRFVIAERATLAVEMRSSAERDAVVRALAPYAPGPDDGAPADVRVTRLEQPLGGAVAEQLGDAGDGLHTTWDASGLRVLHEGACCRLRTGDAIEVELEPGFPWWRAWSEVVRPLLAVPLAAAGAAVVHASAVALDGRGIALGGWAESGKTEVALALCERGARFVSDKWTALADDGTLHALPVAAGLRAWTVPQLPALRGRLARAQRARAAGGRAAAGAVEGLARAGGSGPAAAAALAAARRAAALAGRISLAPGDLDGDRTAPLDTIVVLRADAAPADGAAVGPLDAATARRRLLTTTAYERRGLAALDARSRYCGGPGVADLAGLAACEERILSVLLARCRVVEVAAPFPADPRPAADALLAFLRTA